MDRVVQQNAATAEESASASEEMNAQAEQMKSMVHEMVAFVEGGSDGAAPAAVGSSSRRLKTAPRRKATEDVVPEGVSGSFDDF
jgi:methyl-accepting chemotaxis protein